MQGQVIQNKSCPLLPVFSLDQEDTLFQHGLGGGKKVILGTQPSTQESKLPVCLRGNEGEMKLHRPENQS